MAKQLIAVVGSPGTTALRLGLSALIVLVLQRSWRCGVLVLGERLTAGQWLAISAIVIASIGTVSGGT